MKILVTGHRGFIGGHFFEMFEDKHELVGFDRKEGKDLRFIKPDLTGFDAVINFSAETFVDYSIKNPKKFVEANILGTFNLLEALRNSNIKKLIQVSTDEVYGSLPIGEFATENYPLKPGNPYSASKAAADMLCLSYHNTFNIPLSIVRMENNYGEKQGDEKAIPVFIKHILSGKPVPLYGDGTHRRCWVYVKDTCAAIEGLVLESNNGEIYNIGAKNEITNIDLLQRIGAILGVEYSIKSIPDSEARPGHDRRYGIEPKIKISSDWKLEQVVEWYRQKYQG